MPMAKEINPRLVFDRLFAAATASQSSPAERLKRELYKKSILDFVLDDAQQLAAGWGRTTGARSMNT